ncbi:unnamed protein product [Rhizoctonia solani]|uniref:Uncharacterized protein n=1 Tax=Rhizoctonia solani TaxID=456999 RepID=A0A8H3E9K2_9AGAM|nr:unnamed protein product [Rhizoctonia solani]
MVACIWNLALLVLAAPALAIPTPDETVDLSKRRISGVRGAKCAGRPHIRASIEFAAQEAAHHLNAGIVVGNGTHNYPCRFSNIEGFKFAAGCDAPFFEFPLLMAGIYTGITPQGPDRVIIGSVSRMSADAAFCGVITRTGAPTNSSFVGCTLR